MPNWGCLDVDWARCTPSSLFQDFNKGELCVMFRCVVRLQQAVIMLIASQWGSYYTWFPPAFGQMDLITLPIIQTWARQSLFKHCISEVRGQKRRWRFLRLAIGLFIRMILRDSAVQFGPFWSHWPGVVSASLFTSWLSSASKSVLDSYPLSFNVSCQSHSSDCRSVP